LNHQSSTVNTRQVVELPLAGGRNLNNLILTVPNSASTTGQGTFAVNGNRPRNNNYMVDGSDNNDISVTISTSQMVPEAVAEFQVLQNPYSVEFGRNSGGQINVITKSGTNRFSGDIWDYYQASGLNSRTNIEKDNNLSTPARLIRHQLGGGMGGPVYKDKAFFFGLYQRDTQRPANRPSVTAVTIPTPTALQHCRVCRWAPGRPLPAVRTFSTRSASSRTCMRRTRRSATCPRRSSTVCQSRPDRPISTSLIRARITRVWAASTSARSSTTRLRSAIH
jgi:hypothetical protein